MATAVENPNATVLPITKSSSMTLDPNSKPSGAPPGALSGSSPETNLPIIDETKPCLDVDVDMDSKENDEWRVGSPGPVSPPRKKCMKDRLKGLADKYVSCLQTVDGAGDMRGFAGGGPTLVHGPQPFESPTISPASD